MKTSGLNFVFSVCTQLVLCAPTPGDAASLTSQTQYLISSANITSEFAMNRELYNETFSVSVKGANPGALLVNCTVEWDASRADVTTVTIPLNCTDPGVAASLTRENVVDWIGWDVTVQLE